MWWRFECKGVGEYELALLAYPTGNLTEPESAPNTIAQFITQDGDAGGSNGTAVFCGVTSSNIRIEFGDFQRFLEEVGSDCDNPLVTCDDNCCPFSDKFYEVWIDDVP